MSEYQNPTPIAVHLQQVFEEDGRYGILLIKRADNFGWALPGGYIESNIDTSSEQAAAREFREETGIFVPPGVAMWSKITPAGKLMLFNRSIVPISTLSLARWEATKEALAIHVVYEPVELCYPTHTEALSLWFALYPVDSTQRIGSPY